MAFIDYRHPNDVLSDQPTSEARQAVDHASSCVTAGRLHRLVAGLIEGLWVEALIAALVVALLLLTGCGDDEAIGSQASASPAAPSAATATDTIPAASATATPAALGMPTADPTATPAPRPPASLTPPPATVPTPPASMATPAETTPNDEMVKVLPLVLPSESDVSAIFGTPMRQTRSGPGLLGQEFEGTQLVADMGAIYTSEHYQELMIIVGLALFETEAQVAEFPFTSADFDVPGMTPFDVYDTGDAARGYVLGLVPNGDNEMHMTWLTARSGRVVVSIWLTSADDRDMRDPLRLLGNGVTRWIESVRPDAPVLDIDEIPEAPAPAGLGASVLPSDPAALAAVFERLPSELGSAPRLDVPSLYAGMEEFWHPRCATGCQFLVSWGQEQDGDTPGVLAGVDAVNVIGISNWYPRTWGGGHVIAESALQDRQLRSQLSPGVPTTPPAWTEPGDGLTDGVWRDGALIWVYGTLEVYADPSATDSKPPSGHTITLYELRWGTLNSPWMFSVSASDPELIEELLAAFVAAIGAGDGR